MFQLEESKAKQDAECERIAKAKAELKKEVDTCRRNLQLLVSGIESICLSCFYDFFRRVLVMKTMPN